MLLHLPIVILASLPIIPVSDSVPKFDIARECRSEGGAQAAVDRCAQDEASAQQQLQTEWVQFTANDKLVCTRSTNADGTGSYVELLICLEMARDAKSLAHHGS
ncbi:MAG TPA: hypothetical protein VHB49_17700 [Bradyrhizobium sp.]|nr:hypothetical protein [Bradyrhizobium sp.]